MKRLTKKIDNGRFVTTDAEARSYGETDPEDGFFYNYFTGEAVDKLAAYEDTWLEPADIEELLAIVPKWISVEERLPEESGYTIVFCADGERRHVTFAKYQKTPNRWELTGARSYWRVLRWMSLPEPPKEVQDG